jgi:hypothetical protein
MQFTVHNSQAQTVGSEVDMRASQAFSTQTNVNVLDMTQSDFTNADPMRGSMHSNLTYNTQPVLNPFGQPDINASF